MSNTVSHYSLKSNFYFLFLSHNLAYLSCEINKGLCKIPKYPHFISKIYINLSKKKKIIEKLKIILYFFDIIPCK